MDADILEHPIVKPSNLLNGAPDAAPSRGGDKPHRHCGHQRDEMASIMDSISCT
jgi:hypothetical protein